jgi:hypothetical protein
MSVFKPCGLTLSVLTADALVTQFTESAKIRICPREGKYGIQLPQGTWHSIEVYEPSTIFEAKDGKYGE